jgi:dihydroorotase
MRTSIKLKDLTSLFEHKGIKYYYRYTSNKKILFYKKESNTRPTVIITARDLIIPIEERESERRRENQLHIREDCRDRVTS